MHNAGVYLTWLQLLYVGILLLIFYAAELVFFWLRHGRKNKATDLTVNLQLQIDDLRNELANTRVRLAAIAVQLPSSDFEHNSLNALSVSSALVQDPESPYSHAIRLAQTGADAPEVAAACGISRGEADLIVAIYRSAERN
ncbi:DUF2802 domain-containing protein [Deefgea salmonis]|uniref:DUF2802 domain-containing protein n=1 Tax=Deefgea salmonis TaxID=2875502 RepID=A0ABS8BGP5_9NEIS|nr:DUF2802 domain-containing protein [Deefgea salmonis]MCB5194789.1 DUF2802 domain-containing protein [Deefgea salmonis]